MFLADLAIIMLCEIDIFIEMSISVRNLFSRTSYNGFWSGALKLANYQNLYTIFTLNQALSVTLTLSIINSIQIVSST